VSETRNYHGAARPITPTTPADESVLRAFAPYAGPGTSGYITDFLGVRTRTSFISSLSHHGGAVEGYPIPANFHATGLEWAGTLRAALEAVDELVAVELGAGWGPWLVTAAKAAERRGVRRARLVGVEGSRGHVAYMREHFADNGLDPAAHALVHGIAGPADGEAEFPVLADPAAEWGAAAVLASGERPPAGGATERVRTYSLDTLLKPFTVVDLVHIDIQGHEFEVVAAARDVLRQKVKRVVVGTHGRKIEEQLLNELPSRGWQLEAEEPCIYQQSAGAMQLYIDGCQVWRNTALHPACQ
jgi:FkbM family methyltransferase